nr:altered inheritance of mitochondria protein 9, mitochondrial [Quercus suber]
MQWLGLREPARNGGRHTVHQSRKCHENGFRSVPECCIVARMDLHVKGGTPPMPFVAELNSLRHIVSTFPELHDLTISCSISAYPTFSSSTSTSDSLRQRCWTGNGTDAPLHVFPRRRQTGFAWRGRLASLVSGRKLSSCSVSLSKRVPDDLYEVRLTRHSWNNALRHVERKRNFNALGLKSLAAAAVNRSVEDITQFEKLAEGGCNRTFLLSMRDGFRMTARIPYPVTEPKDLLIASEVATIDYLRARSFPVPEVYDYSTNAENPARTEYILMEVMPGRNLGEIWYDLGEKARIAVVENLVDIESRLFSLDFPASGSLFYTRDLDAKWNGVSMTTETPCSKDSFSIGPDLTLILWYGRRQKLRTFRGPYRDVRDVLAAGAQKEINHLKTHRKPLHHFQRLHRESFDYQRRSPSEHIDLLTKYLQIHQFIVPNDNQRSLKPKLRHPDLQPNNVFVSDDLKITGLIDWQHSKVLPLFLQGGIPGSLQNHGDEVSESLDLPVLPDNFDDIDEYAQFEQVLLLRKRQLHYHYVNRTMESRSVHGEVLIDPRCALRQKLFSRAGAPWEGDSITLKADLIELTKAWPVFARAASEQSIPPCPIEFSEAEQQECSKHATAMQEADVQFRTCLDLVGVGPEGWVPSELSEGARIRAQQLLEDTLEDAESDEERQKIQEHWIFSDFDEDEYT